MTPRSARTSASETPALTRPSSPSQLTLASPRKSPSGSKACCIVKSRRCNPDHREPRAVQQNTLAYDPRIGAKRHPPEFVTQYDHGIHTWPAAVGINKSAPQRWPHTQDFEIVARCRCTIQLLRALPTQRPLHSHLVTPPTSK